MRHFLHYLHRRVVLPNKKDLASERFKEAFPLDRNFVEPTYHVLPSDAVSSTVKPGDAIWMISQLSYASRGRTTWLPVGLDAVIKVKAPVSQENRNLLLVPDAGSRWFPLADATTVLSQVRSKNTSIPKFGTGQSVGRHFQGTRLLLDARPLEDWASVLDSARIHFVSYRQIDGTRDAVDLVANLLRRGWIVYWDRWSLPRRLTERRERVSDAALDQSLLDALTSAACVWGVESPKYFEPQSYSLKEAEIARSCGTYRRAAEVVPSVS